MSDRFEEVPAEDLIRDIGRLARTRADFLTKKRTARKVLEAGIEAAHQAFLEETAEAREQLGVIDAQMQDHQVYADAEIFERHLHLLRKGLAAKQLDTGYGWSKISEPSPGRMLCEIVDEDAFAEWAMVNEPQLLDEPKPKILKNVVNQAIKKWKASDGKFVDQHGVLVPGLAASKPEIEWSFK